MRKFILGFLFSGILFLGFWYYKTQKDQKLELLQTSQLLEKQIKNVSKLIVTEGSYAQIYTYESSKDVFLGVEARKKALVAVNAKATVSYDLNQLSYEVNPKSQVLRITRIPEPELSIYPDFDYYDISADYLNKFEAKDYNTIKKRITRKLQNEIEASSLMSNADERLINELQKIFVLTQSLGWTLEYYKQPVQSARELEILF
ncbi:DUF4230 domain-containing protein [Mesonia sp. HuA40]|uniref:DUF4230 domain-containing protein n=1 Tax=Mesonia sp. HuA40 TaxID=2602761 RepID=UPI0011C96E8F|nr:DUF4230 domain-containing protein [Mesonia sp. HuA40]TXK73227.1 DUF4230 domain-containing protein [Mesonia sp. HuA40]